LKFRKLDDLEVRGKTVLVRVDINSPIDPATGEILDDTRMRECAPTLGELAGKKAKVVILAHQGRPGEKDFVPLKRHAQLLEKILGRPVAYVTDTFGGVARAAIKSLKPGEILLLENVRFCPEELEDKPVEEHVRTELVRKLSELADAHVNDAFAAAHRSQPSLVGFCLTLPSAAGRLMERELEGLVKALSPEKPCAYVLGGAKVDDSLAITGNVLRKNIADLVLTGGLVGQTFLAAAGRDLGWPNLRLLVEKGFEEQIERAKELLSAYGAKIKLPVDLACDDRGERKEISVEELPTELLICDIGSKTIQSYSATIAGAKTVVANGPLGVFEKPAFSRGTFEVLKVMAGSRAFTVIGGGHLVAAAHAAGVSNRLGHVSTGGGACISFLSGEPLPVVEMLGRAKRE